MASPSHPVEGAGSQYFLHGRVEKFRLHGRSQANFPTPAKPRPDQSIGIGGIIYCFAALRSRSYSEREFALPGLSSQDVRKYVRAA